MGVKRILSEEAEMVEMPTQMYSLYYQNIGLQDKPQPKSKVFDKLSVLRIVDIISLANVYRQALRSNSHVFYRANTKSGCY